MAKQNPEVNVTYKLINKGFNEGISSINKQLNSLNKEFRLQKEQMKNTASETEKLEAQLNKLNAEYELAQQKTRTTAAGLEDVKRLTGENSNETRIWSDKLLDAQRNEAYLKNAIDNTKNSLAEATAKTKEMSEAEKQAAEASRQRQEKLSQLKTEQDSLKASSEQLNKQHELEVAQLGRNASEMDKYKLSQKLVGEQLQNSKQQVANLENQLEVAKAEYGENSAEVKKLEDALLDAQIATQKFANEYDNAGQRLQKTGEIIKGYGHSTMEVGKGFTQWVTAPIVAGAAAAVKASSDFETAFTGVKKTVDEAVDSNGKVTISYQDLEQAILSMSGQMPQSAVEIAGVAEAAGQLGVKTENVMEFTRTMLEMGVATNLTADEASTAMMQFANATGMPQDKISNLASSIVELGNNTASTESDILNMGNRLAGAANLAGLTEDNTVALAAAMTSVGINAEAGGGAMSRVIQKMNTEVLSGGANLEGFARIAGKSAQEFAAQWQDDPATAIADFVDGLKKVQESGGDVTQALKDLGINSTQEITTLSNLTGANDLLRDSLEMSADAFEENSALTEEAAKANETFEAQLRITKNKVENIFKTFGDPIRESMADILKSFQGVLDKVQEWADRFAALPKQTQKNILGIVAAFAAIGPIIMIIGGIIIFIGQLVQSIGTIKSAFILAKSGTGIFAKALGLLSGPIGWVILAIMGIVGALIYLWNTNEDVRNKLTEIWNRIREIFSKVAEEVGPKISEAWERIKEKTKEIWERIVLVIQVSLEVISGLLGIFSALLDGDYSLAWQRFKEMIVNIWEIIGPVITEKLEGIKTSISEAWNHIKESTLQKWEEIKQSISDKIAEMKETVVGKVMEIWQGVIDTIEWLKLMFTEIFLGFGSLLWSLIQLAFWPIISLFLLIWDTIGQDVLLAWENIKQWLITKWNEIKTSVTTFFAPIISTISSIWNSVKNDAIAKWNGIKSNLVSKWNGIKTEAASKFNGIKQTVVGKWNQLKTSTSSIWNNIKGIVSRTTEPIRSNISSKLGQAASSAKRQWNSIKSGADSMRSKVVNAVSNMVSRAKSLMNFSWRLPKLKLPHLSISGGFSLNPPKVPRFSISWYAKGGILNGITPLGLSNNTLHMGGEAGPEAVIPLRNRVLGKLGQKIMEATTQMADLQTFKRPVIQMPDNMTMVVNSNDMSRMLIGEMESLISMRERYQVRRNGG